MTLPIVAVAGTPGEMGAAYGERAAELVGGNLQAYARRFRDASGLDETDVRRAGAGLRAVTREHLPRIAEMLDGVAEGAPYQVLLRAVMEGGTLAGALVTAYRHPRSASMNLLLAYSGEAIDVELVPGDAGVIHPRDGMITHANHLETPLPVRDATRDW